MSQNTVETLIGIPNDDRQIAVRELVTARLLNLLGGIEEVPDSLSYIVDEVCIARFNRIGSEGISEHNVEGETLHWDEDLFAPYMEDIQTWRNRQEEEHVGKIRFL